MKTTPLFTLLSLLAATGCSGPAKTAARHEPHVKPGLILLTPAEAAMLRGRETRPAADVPAPPAATGLDASSVVLSPGVKAYTIGRTVDPADRDLMHEAHVVYRRESSPAWRLHAPAGQQILVGPRITDTRQDLQPVLSPELTNFLAEQRRATAEHQQAITALFEAVNALAKTRRTGAVAEPQPAPTPPEKHDGLSANSASR